MMEAHEDANEAVAPSYPGSPSAPQDGPQRSGLRGFLRPFFTAAVLTLGWLSFALILAATAIEHYPGLEELIADTVEREVSGPLGESVDVADVDVLWLRRSVSLAGLTMGPRGEQDHAGGRLAGIHRDGLHVQDVTLRFGWSLRRGVYIDRVLVDGGSVLLSDSLSRGFEGGAGASDGSTLDLLAKSPEVRLRDIVVALATEKPVRGPNGVEEAGGVIELGRADITMAQQRTRVGEDPTTAIYGRFRPSLRSIPRRVRSLSNRWADDRAIGTIWLAGDIAGDHVARVRGVAKSLEISPAALSGFAPADSLAKLRPQAKIDVVAEAEYAVGKSLLPSVLAKVEVSDGRVHLPWLSQSEDRPVEAFHLVAEVGYDASQSTDPLDPAAWSALGTVQADWEDLEAALGFRAGTRAQEGMAVEVWAALPGTPLGPRLRELVADQRDIVEIDSMLAPEGSADVCIGVRIPAAQAPGRPLRESLERMVLVKARGDATLSYHGGIDKITKKRNVGFPLPVRRVVGDVTWSIRSEGRFPGQLAFYDLTGFHAEGAVDVQGSQHFTPLSRFATKSLGDLVPTPFHLIVKTKSLPLDRDFGDAMRGLYGVPDVAEVIPTWNPSGGHIDLLLEIWRTIERIEPSMDLQATLDGVGVRWRELPVPVEDAHGTLRVRTNGGGESRGRALVQLDLEAVSTIARDPIQVAGRVSVEGARGGHPRGLSWFDVKASRVNLRAGDLRQEVGRKNPEAGAALEAVGVTGFADLDMTVTESLPCVEAAALRAASETPRPYLGGLELWAEVRPHDARAGLSVQPTQFPIATRDVQGRLLATAKMPPEVLRDPDTPELPWTAISASIQGEWRQIGPSVPVAVRVASVGESPGRLTAMGAGLDIANRSIVGSLTNAARVAAEATGGMDPVDTDDLDVAGRVDFSAEFTLPEAPGLPTTNSLIGVEARLDKLGAGGDQVLRDVNAHFRYDEAEDEWIGEEIDARLGTTDIELSGLSWRPTDEGSTLRANLSASGLPIDREHLSFFLDPATIRTVLDDLRARGTFDIREATLRLTDRRDGSRLVELDGDLRIEDAFFDLGAPIEIALIESMDVSLNHEGKALRSRATIDGLFGAVAGRRLENASMQLTYVEPRLVIEALDGGFEGGTLRALGSRVAGGADLFGIDLKPPFPFRLAAEMEDVDVGEFLRGVFDSDFANRGIMDLSLALAGDFEHLTEMRGGGEIRIKDSALWAIPVFQALSQRLGIDTTVLFKELLCDYRIDAGALLLDRLRIDSDLLSLVGGGSLSFEGDVTSNLEVRYRLVENLGLFTRLVYWVQNSLLRVSVRGTMERPTVVLRGLISRLFSPSEERDRLPLPGFSKRPRRF